MTDPRLSGAVPPPSVEVGPRWALIALTAAPHDITVATVVRMLDPQGQGAARALTQGELFPFPARPVLVTSSTVYGAVCVERQLRGWDARLPRPWLVLLADVPAPLPVAARYRIRALNGRLAGIAQMPYLPILRTAENAAAAMETKAVGHAAAKLRSRMGGT